MSRDTTVTVLADETRTVPGEMAGGTAVIEAGRLEAAIGWELKPEGLCRDDHCVPVSDPDELAGPEGSGLDLAAVAAALDRPTVLDLEAGVMAVGQPMASRRETTEALTATPFALPDLDGNVRTLEEFRGRKKLLVAFASW